MNEAAKQVFNQANMAANSAMMARTVAIEAAANSLLPPMATSSRTSWPASARRTTSAAALWKRACSVLTVPYSTSLENFAPSP